MSTPEHIDPSKFPCITHREDLVLLTQEVRHLTQAMTTLNREIHDMKEEHILPTITKVAEQEVRLNLISKVVYGVSGAVALQMLAVVGSIIVWAVTRLA
jgi:hypothetical protein